VVKKQRLRSAPIREVSAVSAGKKKSAFIRIVSVIRVPFHVSEKSFQHLLHLSKISLHLPP